VEKTSCHGLYGNHLVTVNKYSTSIVIILFGLTDFNQYIHLIGNGTLYISRSNYGYLERNIIDKRNKYVVEGLVASTTPPMLVLVL